jgi:hypothetical protein
VGQFGIGQFNGAFGPNGQPIQQQTTNVENVTTDIIIQATQKATAPVLRVTIHSPPPPPTPSPPPPAPPPNGTTGTTISTTTTAQRPN